MSSISSISAGYEKPTPEQLVALEALQKEFPPELIGKLPKPTRKDNQKGNCTECGKYHGLPAVHIDYVGHAEITRRLLEVDPLWYWEPYANPEAGIHGYSPTTLWITLHVAGMSRIGVGTVPTGQFESEKQLIGDAIRNAGMRFGMALDLWSKADLEAYAENAGKLDESITSALVAYLIEQPEEAKVAFGEAFGRRDTWKQDKLDDMVLWTVANCDGDGFVVQPI